MRNFGWTTRRGTFVPNTMWRPCEDWFGELRSQYVRTAEAALGPRRGRPKRAQSGLEDEVRSIWRRYNRGVQPPPGLEREVKHAIAQHLRDIASGRRRAWRFELQTLPHPVVGWSALLPGLWGADVTDASIEDELADFGLSGLRWLGGKLATCKGKGPKDCACIAQSLAATNTIGATPIAQAAAELGRLAAERAGGGLESAEWRSACEDLSAIGSELVVRTTELAEAPSAAVLEWLGTAIP